MFRSAIFLVLLAAILAGCDGQVSVEGRQLLEAGKADYVRGDDDAAVKKFNTFLAANPKTSSSDEAYYYRGRMRMDANELPAARADLDQAMIMTRDRGLRASASILLGDILVRQRDLPGAQRMYRGAIDNIDGAHPPLDYALFHLGCVLQRSGQWKEADAQFDRVIFLFDGQSVARLAAQRIRANAWTIHLAVADTKAEAQKLAASLEGQKPAAEVRPIKKDNRLLFAVQAGRYNTYDEALAALAGVQSHHPSAVVIETR